MLNINKKNIIEWAFVLAILALIVYTAAAVRMTTFSAKTVLDFDPWWYYRHALEIMNNDFQPPKWDTLSYYPPGRPFEPFLGWIHTLIIFFEIAKFFVADITFLTIAKLSPVIMAALAAIPAFFLGRLLTNKTGGLVTALFAVLAPTFIGVSMAGYSDNDPVIVFYTFASILSILIAIQKKSIPFYVLAVIVNIIFAYNWNGGWFVSLLFLAFIPALAIFRVIEDFVHERGTKVNIENIKKELKSIVVPLLIVIVSANVIGAITNLGNVFTSFLISLGFINPGQGLLVNQSVAELQRLNILSIDGFATVAARIGLAPTLFAIIGLPLLVVYRLYKKTKIEYYEIFLFLWLTATFFMILNGTRFSLQFSSAAAAASGYFIGQFFRYGRASLAILSVIMLIATALSSAFLIPTFFVIVLAVLSIYKHREEHAQLYLATLLGVTVIFALLFITDAIQAGQSSTGLIVNDNWISALDWLKNNADKDALVTTWWDPGHIIAGHTGLKVHADGAHCPPGECIPYNHNTRIRDMGRAFSISDENESANILKKYMEITPEQCNEARRVHGDKMPQDACRPVSEMYVLATGDLIGKYYWLSFFGTGSGRNFVQCDLSQDLTTQQGTPTYACRAGFQFTVTLLQQDNNLLAVLNAPTEGLRNAVSRQLIVFPQGKELRIVANSTSSVDGMVFIDPSFNVAMFMDKPVRDSIFTNMFFFNGEGIKEFGIQKLEKYELVYSNSEAKIFRVRF